ncbi:MAG: hypothetical protein ACLQOO_05310 [Terriglobia bacterium]
MIQVTVEGDNWRWKADEVAQKIEADIILPKSAIKPEHKGGLVRSLRSLLGDQQAHSYRGPLVLGIRDCRGRELGADRSESWG